MIFSLGRQFIYSSGDGLNFIKFFFKKTHKKMSGSQYQRMQRCTNTSQEIPGSQADTSSTGLRGTFYYRAVEHSQHYDDP